MVVLQTRTLSTLLSELEVSECRGKISIPDYQRVYCWPEKQVLLLLEDLLLRSVWASKYHLGTVILQYKSGKWNIIDGQQRLVTLSILLLELGDATSPLLYEQIKSKEANEYVAYNRYLIRNFLSKMGWNDVQKVDIAGRIKENVSLDTLFLTDESYDLAYTFFSAQNDRGKPLTDYELLKSHHLRYIPWESQQKFLAQKWDQLLLNYEREEGDKRVSIVMKNYLYCLRKWSMMEECDPHAKRAVKNEFEAAEILPEVPPFGEAFFYNESIQGGSHFFAYVDHFVARYPKFQQTNAYQNLWNTISCSGAWNGCADGKKATHWWYGDVIAAFLFAYYLKFGEEYLLEAATGIARIVSESRYSKGKANFDRLMKNAGTDSIILLMNRATSPTFFLAEIKRKIMQLPVYDSFKLANGHETIRDRYLKLEKAFEARNAKDYVLDFKSIHLK